MVKKASNILCFILLLSLIGCGPGNRKFNPNEWNDRVDFFYAHRESMIDDLLKNHLKKGMSYAQVIGMLGNPDSEFTDSPFTLSYEIMVDYGWNIDPQKGTTLIIELAPDSTVGSFRLEKWKH